MLRKYRRATCLAALLALTSVITNLQSARGQFSWDGGGGNFLWGTLANWSPDGDPNFDPVSIGDLPAAANDTTLLNASFSIDSLSLSNGADVINSSDGGNIFSFDLVVNGATILSNAGTSNTVYGGTPNGLDTNTLTINSGADLILNSQQPAGTAVVEVDAGALTNNSGGIVSGNGRLELDQSVAGATTLFNNEGTLTAGAIGLIINAPATTLQITASDFDARVDLDGAVGNQGVVNVNRNATLDVNVQLSDGFGGDLNLSSGSKLDIASPWVINAGTVDVNTPGQIVGTAGPAAHLAGGLVTMQGGTITLNDGLDSLVVDAAFTGDLGTLANSGTVTFNAPTTFGPGFSFNMVGNDAKLVVNSTVNVDMPNFNLDGNGGAGNVTTINTGGNLDLDLGAGADRFFSHTININGGELDVLSSVADDWGLDLDGTLNAGGGAVSTLQGDLFVASGNGSINVAADSTLNIVTTSKILGATNFTIADGGELNFGTVDYAHAGATFTGNGTLKKGNATITAPTTWDVAVVDLDDGTTTLNANLTILAEEIEEAPADSGFDSTITINDTRLLSVTIEGLDVWLVDEPGVITYNGNASPESFLSGSAIGLNGTINHNGDGRIDARLSIGPTGVVNINTAGEPLRLSGGDNNLSANLISGGKIQGPGILAADVGTALRGFGTIDADLEFLSNTQLIADNGTLEINGDIVSVSEIHVLGADAVLDVTNPWNTIVAASITISDGELTGGTITNDGVFGIRGRGLLSAQVINNTRIRGANSGTLVVETPGNNNDWDGATNTGLLWADSADLELRDDGIFLFSGTVTAAAGRSVFVNGFELEFQPGSTLNLTGGTFIASGSNHFGGAVNVAAGSPSVIAASDTAYFESSSITTLDGNLELESPLTVVGSSAEFAGGGRLIVAQERTLAPNIGSTIGVLVENRGTHEVAGASIGRNDVLEYVMREEATIRFDIFGTDVGVFDRMFVDGQMELAGTLALGIGITYVPTLGDTVTLISALGGFVGEFDSLAQPAGLPSGLQFALEYQPQFVRVTVIEQLAGDYNYDGVVDAADYTVWRDSFGSSALLAADGNKNNMIDAGDYDVWKNGFGDVAGSGAKGQSVPEPGVTILVVLGLLKLGHFRRR